MMKTQVVRTKFHRLFASVCGLVIVICAGPAWAGGLYLNEFTTPSMGVAGAGAEAIANDASTSFALHNPAGMTRLKESQLMLGGGLVFSTIQFDPDPNTPIPGNDGGDAGGPAPLLAAFYSHSLTDDLKLGFNVFSLSAAVLDYNDDWTGRFLAQEVTLLTVTLNPSVAYRVNDWLSLGAGMTVKYAKLEQKVAVPTLPAMPAGQATIDGDDFAFGFNLGALIEVDEGTRFGVIYQSEVEPDFSGDVEITPPGLSVGITTKLPFAQLVRIGAYHELSDKVALLGTIGWEDWSTFDEQLLSVARGSAVIKRNWRDTWHFSGGIHYRPADRWLLQSGVTYDTSPVSENDRTPDLPLDRQIRGAIGAQYEWSETVTVGAAFVYANYGSAPINSTLLIGDYSRNDLFFFAINANWKFGQPSKPPATEEK